MALGQILRLSPNVYPEIHVVSGGSMLRVTKRLYQIFLIVAFIPTLAFSQDVLTLTLEQCVNTALEKNPGIQIAEKELKKPKLGSGRRMLIWDRLLMPVRISSMHGIFKNKRFLTS